MAHKRKKKRNTGLLERRIIAGIVTVIAVCLIAGGIRLKAKNRGYAKEVARLESQIEDESQRAQEIEDLQEYMKTDEYIEDVARDKLGLVYEGETVFRPAE